MLLLLFMFNVRLLAEHHCVSFTTSSLYAVTTVVSSANFIFICWMGCRAVIIVYSENSVGLDAECDGGGEMGSKLDSLWVVC